METKFKGTPGKWAQSHRPIPNDKKGMYATQVYTEYGETIATLAWCPKPPSQEIENGKNITVIRSYREANAKLIAQSPDMLEEISETVIDLKILKNQIADANKTNHLFDGMPDLIQKWIDRKELIINKALE